MPSSVHRPPTCHVIVTGISRGLGAALFDLLLDADIRLFGIGRTFSDKTAAGRRAAA